jgi:hypothetical protein
MSRRAHFMEYLPEYDIYGHPKHSTLANMRKQSRIIEKMRKAGITDAEIDWLLAYYQTDALHIANLAAMSTVDQVQQQN